MRDPLAQNEQSGITTTMTLNAGQRQLNLARLRIRDEAVMR